MECTVNERIDMIISNLNYKSKRAFAEAIGVAQTSLNDIIKGAEPKYGTLIKILKAEPLISAEWLLRGEGPMIRDEEPPRISYTSGVPYYNVDFIGGFDIVLNDQTINPEYYIDFKLYNNAECWCNVTGKSMEPEISSGDIIALKELKDWRTYIPSGEIYAIVTTEHRTVKRISPLKKKGYITLIPSNPDPKYCIQDIPLDIVMKVYKVLGCMKRM